MNSEQSKVEVKTRDVVYRRRWWPIYRWIGSIGVRENKIMLKTRGTTVIDRLVATWLGIRVLCNVIEKAVLLVSIIGWVVLLVV